MSETTVVVSTVRDAVKAINEATEAELVRIMPQWPAELGQPSMAYDHLGVFIGLCREDTPIGEPCVIVVPARRIELKVTT